ncbi:hypothetical protein [Streptomyces sp. NPDC088246]|uniref:hypothetical protein n=1 Tax=Streptomyces sp. NPDC088246 TaxID=3365842 RepID=UPI00380C4A35
MTNASAAGRWGHHQHRDEALFEERVLNHAVAKQARRVLRYDHQALLAPPSDARLSPDVTVDRDRVDPNQRLRLRLTRAAHNELAEVHRIVHP